MRQTSPQHLLALLILFAALLVAAAACSDIEDAVGDALDDEEATLKEEDLPNCSKVITCCAKLQDSKYDDIVPEAVREQCADVYSPAADTVTGFYAERQSDIDGLPGLTDEQRAMQKDDFKTTSQDKVEPGCRCFLEETIGTIGDTLLPKDCEIRQDVGALEPPAMCSDATTALFDTAASGF